MSTAEVREVEHSLHNLGWTELFAYLCPGAIMLLSVALWVQPHLADVFGEEMPHNEFVFAIVFLLLSYAVGLPVARAGEGFANRYLLARAKRDAFDDSRASRIWLTLAWAFWTLISWIPEWPHTPYFVRERLRLQDEIENSGLPGLSIAVNPWANLAIYRVLVAERLSRPATLVLREAESVHRRCLFALGVSCALMVVFFEALARMILQVFLPHELAVRLFGSPPSLSSIGLGTLIVGTWVASFVLRYVAGRFWEIEFLLTCSDLLNPRLNVATPGPSAPFGWRSIFNTLVQTLRNPGRRG
jgi:hypothetical protein